ncbi:TonB-dependent receptor [Mucilaginibacter boryungensis]|uniref:TonB-dependent receptor n=1 Tax=Mucilaginibacter boryungensis TaxID=768480 RepID=A0ABR9XJ90_9SPHI|nr:TonB-dependent receptor [Mucilaginibacter boryungensis]MBE9667446.1 TonB-dependent receptor [Mucilaginibacter boryungensis]
MAKRLYLLPLLLIPTFATYGQTQTGKPLTTDTIKTVTIKAYLSAQPVISIPASVSVLGPSQFKLQADNSFVPALNTVPGVKMEERSPGSYRLSIRGSLLRSPFGVRDVKIYFDEIPLTDAGGNTYLNAIDVNSIRSVEILKGPDGSLFGANSGGVVILRPLSTLADSNYAKVGFNAGSYGLLHQNAAIQNSLGKNQLNISQAYQSYGGYREHSYMDRQYFQLGDKYNISAKDGLKVLALYSNLAYETPGGLTLAQMQANPQSARLATKTVPGAIDQQIRITTKVFLGGLVNEAQLSDHLKNVTSVSTMHVDFANPFITNYEQRTENTYALRSYFELANGKNSYSWKVNLGMEWQQTKSVINNYDNNAGVKGNPQKFDNIHSKQHFVFGRYAADIQNKLHLEVALSLNYYNYTFQNIYPLNQSGFTDRNFSPQLMPRLALSYSLTYDFIARASVSRGYSTPTTAEVRPTDNVVNTALQAQTGWNYETGLRLRNRDESLYLDASVFYYRIRNAIVRRLHPDETEYYTNAGGTNQTGFELAFTDWLIRQNNSRFIRGLQFNTAYTLSSYFFRDYSDATTNYSGNPLTGVPKHVIVSSLQVKVPHQLYLFVQHNYTASIPLNDANTVFAPQYHLLQSKIGWAHAINHKIKFELYAGADNLLNAHYSLGNDLNAVGSRYFNPSPLRNYFAGFNVIF